ncbi:LDH2 family malate/lactate/ureidoglycolate dehydrogenase [Tepidamorphus gemmatus]|uniref:LDH2 family malate/lactate/ureidoglycolate dehydrogenase n=1 Tax=Tepidamorphus gemmatus TaxID=747076 RepID=A0A4R3MH18_9HYPH|nr:LDH2 family malate/lactate/ureidoglycolate dehydrogenase [Tepidamorphus gemmatus]
MTVHNSHPEDEAVLCAEAGALRAFSIDVLSRAGADAATAEAATRAMMHGSCLGVDSHGIRLLAHYVAALKGGRVNPAPTLRLVREVGATAVLDAGHGHGALAAYTAMDHAVRLAGSHGTGAVAIRNSSHFGPAGAYALAAAERGLIGLATCNSDSFVSLHDGAERFHGTNPLAVAAPVAGGEPWLLDMATSAITYNRVQLHRSLGRPLDPGVAAAEDGSATTDPERASMLAPLGGPYGYKGAGLAGLSEILSAVLTGMRISPEILPMAGPDLSSPREMGAFVLAIDPGAFLPAEVFLAGMARYLAALRQSRPLPGARVLAPGDREWAERDRRMRDGIPIDPATAAAFVQLARTYGLTPPIPVSSVAEKQP